MEDKYLVSVYYVVLEENHKYFVERYDTALIVKKIAGGKDGNPLYQEVFTGIVLPALDKKSIMGRGFFNYYEMPYIKTKLPYFVLFQKDEVLPLTERAGLNIMKKMLNQGINDLVGVDLSEFQSDFSSFESDLVMKCNNAAHIMGYRSADIYSKYLLGQPIENVEQTLDLTNIQDESIEVDAFKKILIYLDDRLK